VPSHFLLEVGHFFPVYKDLEGKRTKALGRKDRDAAQECIRASYQRYMDSNAGLVRSEKEIQQRCLHPLSNAHRHLSI
jgi:inorganic pyrophosphatase